MVCICHEKIRWAEVRNAAHAHRHAARVPDVARMPCDANCARLRLHQGPRKLQSRVELFFRQAAALSEIPGSRRPYRRILPGSASLHRARFAFPARTVCEKKSEEGDPLSPPISAMAPACLRDGVRSTSLAFLSLPWIQTRSWTMRTPAFSGACRHN